MLSGYSVFRNPFNKYLLTSICKQITQEADSAGRELRWKQSIRAVVAKGNSSP